jgi:hypothetical protein
MSWANRNTERTRSTGTPPEYLFGDLLGGKSVPRVLDHRLYRHPGSFDNPLFRHLAGLPFDIRGFRPIHCGGPFIFGLPSGHLQDRHDPLLASKWDAAKPPVFAARRL